jgi:hypothetical protein
MGREFGAMDYHGVIYGRGLADRNEFIDLADVAEFLDLMMCDGDYLSYLGRQVRLHEMGVQVLPCQVLYRSYQLAVYTANVFSYLSQNPACKLSGIYGLCKLSA